MHKKAKEGYPKEIQIKNSKGKWVVATLLGFKNSKMIIRTTGGIVHRKIAGVRFYLTSVKGRRKTYDDIIRSEDNSKKAVIKKKRRKRTSQDKIPKDFKLDASFCDLKKLAKTGIFIPKKKGDNFVKKQTEETEQKRGLPAKEKGWERWQERKKSGSVKLLKNQVHLQDGESRKVSLA